MSKYKGQKIIVKDDSEFEIGIGDGKRNVFVYDKENMEIKKVSFQKFSSRKNIEIENNEFKEKELDEIVDRLEKRVGKIIYFKNENEFADFYIRTREHKVDMIKKLALFGAGTLLAGYLTYWLFSDDK